MVITNDMKSWGNHRMQVRALTLGFHSFHSILEPEKSTPQEPHVDVFPEALTVLPDIACIFFANASDYQKNTITTSIPVYTQVRSCSFTYDNTISTNSCRLLLVHIPGYAN